MNMIDYEQKVYVAFANPSNLKTLKLKIIFVSLYKSKSYLKHEILINNSLTF